jgi:hypothetical protein
MKITVQKFLQGTLASLVVFYGAFQCKAITTTTVVVAGIVRKAPSVKGDPLAAWPVGVYLDEKPSEAAHCTSGQTNRQGLYNIAALNLANVIDVWILNEEQDDQKPESGQAKPAHVHVQLSEDKATLYPVIANELVLTLKSDALTESDAATKYLGALIYDQAARVFLNLKKEDVAKEAVLHVAMPIISSQYSREPNPEDREAFWKKVSEDVRKPTGELETVLQTALRLKEYLQKYAQK